MVAMKKDQVKRFSGLLQEKIDFTAKRRYECLSGNSNELAYEYKLELHKMMDSMRIFKDILGLRYDEEINNSMTEDQVQSFLAYLDESIESLRRLQKDLPLERFELKEHASIQEDTFRKVRKMFVEASEAEA